MAETDTARTETAELQGGIRTEELFVNMGPQHPSTHGVLRVLAKIDGETIQEAHADIGYLHRCFEKIAEKRPLLQVIPYTDRTDYLAAIANEHVFCMAVERLMGIQVPLRAEYIRFIMSELQRVASHLIWFGTFALDLGATTAFLYAWRERERLLDIFEAVTGARMLYNYFRFGGVRNDLYDGFAPAVERFLSDLEKIMVEYDNLLTKSRIFQMRTQGVGVLTREEALAYGASGPVLRSAGVKYDVRKNDPYSLYNHYDFDIPVGKNGDSFDRYMIRLQEIHESIKLIRYGLRDIPDDGEIVGDVPRRLRLEGDTYARIESPRGEVACYLVGQGKGEAYRLSWRSPCFVHLQLLNVMGQGGLIADLVASIGSIDIVMGEVDR